MQSHRAARRLALIAAVALPAGTHAQGFGLNEIGSCAVARGFATTGLPCSDASVIYWNPAAATSLTGWSVYAGVTAIAVSGEFTQDTTGSVFPGKVPLELAPHLFVNVAATPRLATGLGIYVPYGLTSQWQEDFPGRFAALRASIGTIYVQPNIAYELVPGRLSVGGGPVFGRSDLELVQGVDLSTQLAAPDVTFGMLGIPAQTEFARATLEGSGSAWGFHLALHGTPTPTLRYGLRYLSQLDFAYEDVDVSFRQIATGLVLAADNPFGVPADTPLDAILQPQFAAPNPLVSQRASTRIRHPAQLQVGLGYTGIERTQLSIDYALIGWSAFRELAVEFDQPVLDRTIVQDYHDSWSIRTGVEHLADNGWKLRGGFSYVTTPVPDATVTPMLPDMNRYNFALGVGIPFAGRYSLDATYLRWEADGRRGSLVERQSRTQTTAQLNTGVYALQANIFSLTLKAQF